MPKYWVKNYFAHGSFPEVGQKQKTEKKKNKIYPLIFFLHISSSYAKILGETNFHKREITRSGLKAKDGEKKKEREKEERLYDGDNNGQATHGARKHAWSMQAAWANWYNIILNK